MIVNLRAGAETAGLLMVDRAARVKHASEGVCMSPQLSVPWAPTYGSITESEFRGHLHVHV